VTRAAGGSSLAPAALPLPSPMAIAVGEPGVEQHGQLLGTGLRSSSKNTLENAKGPEGPAGILPWRTEPLGLFPVSRQTTPFFRPGHQDHYTTFLSGDPGTPLPAEATEGASLRRAPNPTERDGCCPYAKDPLGTWQLGELNICESHPAKEVSSEPEVPANKRGWTLSPQGQGLVSALEGYLRGRQFGELAASQGASPQEQLPDGNGPSDSSYHNQGGAIGATVAAPAAPSAAPAVEEEEDDDDEEEAADQNPPPPPPPATAACHAGSYSIGSLGHPDRCAVACKYNTKARGCKDGTLCSRCHLCKWKRRTDMKKQRTPPHAVEPQYVPVTVHIADFLT